MKFKRVLSFTLAILLLIADVGPIIATGNEIVETQEESISGNDFVESLEEENVPNDLNTDKEDSSKVMDIDEEESFVTQNNDKISEEIEQEDEYNSKIISTESTSQEIEETKAFSINLEENLVEPSQISENAYKNLLKSNINSNEVLAQAFDLMENESEVRLPSSADGSNIEHIAVEWITEDDNPEDSILNQTWTDNFKKQIRLRINFAVSGQHDYEPGTVSITIPKHIFKDREGNPVGNMSLAVPKAPDNSGLFSYIETDDSYVITNTKLLQAASSGLIEATIGDLLPSDIKDKESGYTSDPFTADITVTTPNGTLIGLKSDEINAEVDTNASISNAHKSSDKRIYSEYPSNWPQELKPTNANDYYYVKWDANATVNGNQNFSVSVTDTATGSDPEAIVLGYRHSRTGEIIPGNNTGVFTAQIEEDVYLANGRQFFGAYYVAYPKNNYAEKKEYKFQNAISFKLTAQDDGKVTEAPASSEFTLYPIDGSSSGEGEGRGPIYTLNKNGTGPSSTRIGGEVYGIYPSDLNRLADGVETIDIKYNIASFASKGSETPDEYITVIDDEVSIDGLGVLDSSEYNFKSLNISKPVAKARIAVQQEGNFENDEGIEFTSIPQPDFSYQAVYDTDIPEVVIYGRTTSEGAWKEYGKLSYLTGIGILTPSNGASVNNQELIFPQGIVEYKVEALNSVDQFSLSMTPTITLFNNDELTELATDLLNNSTSTSLKVINKADLFNKETNEASDYTLRVSDIGEDRLTGLVHGLYATKSLVNYENDTTNKLVKLNYTVKQRIQTNASTMEILNEGIESDYFKEQKAVTFYELLPYGVVPLTDSIQLRDGDTLTGVQLIENYKGSGRTMMIVDVEVTPNYRYDSGRDNPMRMSGYYDEPTLSFSANYGWDAISDYGKNLDNAVAVESDLENPGNIKGYLGEPDNPNTGNNIYSNKLDDMDKDILKDLNPDHDNPSFVYTTDVSDIEADTYTLISLSKTVDVNNEGAYGDGLDNLLPKNVYEGGSYSYNIRLKNAPDTTSTGLIFYDNLENLVPGNLENDGREIVEIAKQDKDDVQWRGTFEAIELIQLETLGIKPVVYYSTSETLRLDDTENRSDNDISNSAIWTTVEPEDKSTIRAIAVDARKDVNGEDFVLPENGSLSFIIRMRAPMVSDLANPGEEEEWYDKTLEENQMEAGLTGGAHAYNNISLINTTSKAGSQSDEELIRHDYTKVGLKAYSIDLTKEWDDDNDRDGLRPEQATFTLYADGVATDKKLTLSEDNNWEGTFGYIPYQRPDGARIFYTIKEDTVNGYSFNPGTPDNKDGGEGLVYNATNIHIPSRINIEGEKIWNDNEVITRRPERIQITLYKNDVEFRTVHVTPDDNSKWYYSFDNLYEFENGEKINYTVKETDYVTGYKQEVKDFNIINTYDPYGDIQINKVVNNGSEASKAVNPNFEFTFYLKDKEGEYNNDLFNYTTTLGNQGQISSGGTIKFKEDEIVTIHRVNSEHEFTLVETSIPSGYTFNQYFSENLTGSLQAGEVKESTFVNDYSAKGNTTLEVNKLLEGRNLKLGEFQFEVVDENGQVVRIGYNNTTGKVDFGQFEFDSQDIGKTINYTIREVNGGKPGVKYDESSFEVSISLSDDGKGNILAETTLANEADSITFKNTYEAKGELELSAYKQILGGFEVEADKFEFIFTDAENNLETRGFADKNGFIQFNPIEINQEFIGKTLTFIGKEVIPATEDEYIYDETEIKATVEVLDNGTGELMFNIQYEDQFTQDISNESDRPVFVNKLKPGSLSIQKQITTGNQNQEFKFRAKIKGPEAIMPKDSTFELEREMINPIRTNEVTNNLYKNEIVNIEDDTDDESEKSIFEKLKDLFVDAIKPAKVYAQTRYEFGDVRFRGTQGGVTWEIDNNGNLRFRPTNGTSGTFNTMGSSDTTRPWSAYQRFVTNTVFFEPGVHANAALSYMFQRFNNTRHFDLTNLTISNRPSLSFMFRYAGTVTTEGATINIGSLNLTEVSSIQYMFDGSKFKKIDLSSSPSTSLTTNSAFSGTITELDITPIQNIKDGSIPNNGSLQAIRIASNISTWEKLNLPPGSWIHENGTRVDTFRQLITTYESDKARYAGWWYRDRSIDVSYNNQSDYPTNPNIVSSNIPVAKTYSLKDSFTLVPPQNANGVKHSDGFTYTFKNYRIRAYNSSGTLEGYIDLPANTKTIRIMDLFELRDSESYVVSYYWETKQVRYTYLYDDGREFAVDFAQRGTEYTYRTVEGWTRKNPTTGLMEKFNKWELFGYDQRSDGYVNPGQTITVDFISGYRWGTLKPIFVPYQYKVNFDLNGASGSMSSQVYDEGQMITLPSPSSRVPNKVFKGWSTTKDGDVINSTNKDFTTAGNAITLYAVWGEVDNSVTMKDGEFEFTLYPGDKVTLPELAAGLTYEIYEDTEDGWVLVSETNTMGTIKPEENSLAEFVNEYNPTAATHTIEGNKLLDGISDNVEGYIFDLYQGNILVDTATSTYDGSYRFNQLVYNSAGTYTYTVKERAGNDPTIKYDTKVETITVTVTADANGNLSAKSVAQPFNESTFVVGSTANTGQFLYQSIGKVNEHETYTLRFDEVLFEGTNHPGVATVRIYDQNNTAGYTRSLASFEINPNQKEYTFTVPEITNPNENVQLLVYSGRSGATANKQATFTNLRLNKEITFNNTTITGDLQITKEVVGTEADNIEFSIKVVFDNLNEQLIKLKAGETYTFEDIKVGTTYTIEEIDLPEGYELQSISNKEGSINEEVTLSTVTNLYKPNGSATIQARKVLVNKELEASEFTFELLNNEKEVIDTVTNSADGLIQFGALQFDEAGEYIYYVREVRGDNAQIEYDASEKRIIVTVEDKGEGILEASVNYGTTSGEGITFINTFNPEEPPVEESTGNVTITKEVVGTNAQKPFKITVSLIGSEGPLTASYQYTTNQPRNGTVSHNGEIEIYANETITIENLPKDTRVRVVETVPSGYTLSSTSTLNTIVETEKTNEIKLLNIYMAEGSLTLEGQKKLLDQDISDYSFNFLLMEDGQIISRATNDQTGKFIFEPVEYTLDHVGKTFTYEVVEEFGNEINIKYDNRLYEVTVTVEDNGEGQLLAVPTIKEDDVEADSIEFINKYEMSLPVTGSYQAGITITGLLALLFIGLKLNKNKLQGEINETD